jgi:voltage-gated potassium channel
MVAYRAFYENLSEELKTNFDMASDHQRYHSVTSSKMFARKFNEGLGCKNNIVLRVAWSACLWDSRRIAIAKTIAEALSRHFDSETPKAYLEDLKIKKCGY